MGRAVSWIRLVFPALLLTACSAGSGVVQPTFTPAAVATPTGLRAAATVTQTIGPSWDHLVGWWEMIDGGFYYEFRADGSCARHLESAEDTFWTTDARCQLIGTDRLVVQLRGDEPIEYDWRLEEPWLILRDASGRVTRYRRQ